ncbi:hypothetical protein [Arthrobacter sp. HLT1-21]
MAAHTTNRLDRGAAIAVTAAFMLAAAGILATAIGSFAVPSAFEAAHRLDRDTEGLI